MNGRGVARPIGLVSLALVLAAGCGPKRVGGSAPPRTQVVLLPDPDSNSPSAATVTSPSGTVALATPFESTTVVGAGAPGVPVKIDEADVQRQFGAVLGDLPQPTEHFNLYFRTDSSDLTDESRALLPGVISAIGRRTVPEVSVIGHTDTTGNAENNRKLGLERAHAVRALLVAAGLDAALIEVESHGEADPLRKTPDNTPEPRNRRVEISVR